MALSRTADWEAATADTAGWAPSHDSAVEISLLALLCGDSDRPRVRSPRESRWHFLTRQKVGSSVRSAALPARFDPGTEARHHPATDRSDSRVVDARAPRRGPGQPAGTTGGESACCGVAWTPGLGPRVLYRSKLTSHRENEPLRVANSPLRPVGTQGEVGCRPRGRCVRGGLLGLMATHRHDIGGLPPT